MRRLKSKLLLVCALTLLLSAAQVAVSDENEPPSNDDCSNAEQVGDVMNLPFDTTYATFDGPNHYIDSQNIWYCYTATCTGCATVSLLGSSFDTVLAVYDGNDCYQSLENMIEYNDDFFSLQSHLTFPVIAGNLYLIEVGGWSSNDFGEGVINISCDPKPCQPPNDDCTDAKQVGNVTDLSCNTRWATFDGPGHCMTSSNIWYCYTASSTDNVTVTLTGNYDTMLAIYDGCDCNPTMDDLIGCNDDAGYFQSQLSFAATEGNQYLIEVGGYSSETGQCLMTICSGEQPGPPANDDCNDAESVGDVTNLIFNTSYATFDGPGHCMTSPNIWYCYTASCTGEATVSLVGSGYDTMLAVYNGCECYPEADDMIECDDDSGPNFTSEITFAATVGNQYLIEIGGYGSDTGQGLLNISCEGVIPKKPDLGDAPDSTNNFGSVMHAYTSQGLLPVLVHPTVFNDGSGLGPYGPVHLNPIAVANLGKIVTHEVEADIGLDQDGVNNIDPPADTPNKDDGDDGVIFPVNMPHCRWTTFDYIINVVDPNIDLWVNVWCDWNRDGDWDDTSTCPCAPAPEWAVQNQYLFNLPTGLNQITTPAFISWHPNDGPEEIWMRITLSEQPWRGGSNPELPGNGGSGPKEKYEIGETEDYYFAPDTICSICEDLNGDGIIDIQDLILYVTEWFDNCL
ncbi:MAG: GEVED domain-containing protein [Planctomycetota bacterium]|jgi:hypothetical protein